VSAVATTRCISGKVVLTTVVKNSGPSAIDVTTATSFGSKTVKGVAPGASGTTATTTRAASVTSGSVAITATSATGTSQESVAYASRSCG